VTVVIGRAGNDPEARSVAELGTYRAVDGSKGAGLALDVDGPHAVLVVGKRGSGKTYTLGVLAEELARTRGLAPVVVDPMGAFAGLDAGVHVDGVDDVPATVVDEPAVPPSALDPRSWCGLLGIPPESGTGALVWQAATAADTLGGMADHVRDADAPTADARAATNHLALADSWGVFDPDGLAAADLGTNGVTVLDVSGLAPAPANAVVRAAGEALYRARVAESVGRFPWLLVDEAHTFFDGVAAGTLELLLTRGRAPGVSLVLATQRPSAAPPIAASQSDVLFCHRLTSRADRDALSDARPAVGAALDERMPEAPGEVAVLDDATESVHAARIRQRHTPHAGGSPSVAASVDRR